MDSKVRFFFALASKRVGEEAGRRCTSDVCDGQLALVAKRRLREKEEWSKHTSRVAIDMMAILGVKAGVKSRCCNNRGTDLRVVERSKEAIIGREVWALSTVQLGKKVVSWVSTGAGQNLRGCLAPVV